MLLDMYTHTYMLLGALSFGGLGWFLGEFLGCCVQAREIESGACVCVSVCVYVYLCVYASVRVGIYVCMCICVYESIYVQV
jgi:hypothetical protein